MWGELLFLSFTFLYFIMVAFMFFNFFFRYDYFLQKFWSGLSLNLNVQIYKKYPDTHATQMEDYYLLTDSSIEPYGARYGCNISRLFQIVLTSEVKSTVQIHNDDCHFWYHHNAATESNLRECLLDFSFSVFRYFNENAVSIAITQDKGNVVTIDHDQVDSQQRSISIFIKCLIQVKMFLITF